MARFVRTGQSDEHGLKTLVARAEAGDVIYFVAMVDRIAQILAERGDTDPVDVRRSKALGILANPTRALTMLVEAAGSADEAERADPRERPGDPDAPADPDDDHEPCPACEGSGLAGDPAPFTRHGLDLSGVDPKRLLPAATLYVHLHESTLRRGGGVARMEGVGPITVAQVQAFLAHTNVTVVPVRDVADQSPVDGYEVPARIREALHLRSPACAFPWATHLSRRKDADHVRRYVPPGDGGPPGQTSMANLAWLARLSHRLKTHGRWRLRQPAPGVLEWRSPHGYWWRVDHQGTHPLGKESAAGVPPRPHTGRRPWATSGAGSAQEARLAELIGAHGHG